MMRLPRRDRGAATVFFTLMMGGWVSLLALVMIGGGRVRATQRAYYIAAEAARAGGQVIDAGSAIEGGPKRLNPTAARQAALNYLTAAGATGTVVIVDDETIEVTASVVFSDPTGLPMMGEIGNQTRLWTATGTATATLVVR